MQDALPDILPSDLHEGYYYAMSSHTGRPCLVRVVGTSPFLTLQCHENGRDRPADFRFLARVPTYSTAQKHAELWADVTEGATP